MYSPGKDRAISRIRTGYTWESSDPLFQSRGWHCIFFSTYCPTEKKFSSLMAVKSTWMCVYVWGWEGREACAVSHKSFQNCLLRAWHPMSAES